MVRTFPIIILALVFLTTGATAQKSDAPAADYFPLRVGDSWTYRMLDGSTQYNLKVIGEEKQTDGTVRFQVEKLAGAKVMLSFSKKDGWVLLHSEVYPEHEGLEAKYEPAKQYLKNPLVSGAQWGWQGTDYTKTEVVEDNQVTGPEEVTVAAGKFQAMKIVAKVAGTTSLVRTSWYAPGVGLVKSISVAGEIKYGWELADYSFRKK